MAHKPTERPLPPASRLPRVPLLVLAFCLLLTGLAWAGVRVTASSDRKHLIWLGDSFTGNYRMAAPERLQDLSAARLGADWQVWNFGAPGAFALDILLQAHSAWTLTGKVDAVVVPLFVSKLRTTQDYPRLDGRGETLKWLRLTDDAEPVLAALDAGLHKKLAVHKAGLWLFGSLDLASWLWRESVQWPWERERMRANPPERQQAMAKKAAEHAAMWQQPLDPASLTTSAAARDLQLLFGWAKAKQIKVLVLLLPAGDPDYIAASFQAEAKANHRAARDVLASWCAAQGVDTADMTEALGGGLYDDFTHLKHARGNQILVDAVAKWLGTEPQQR